MKSYKLLATLALLGGLFALSCSETKSDANEVAVMPVSVMKVQRGDVVQSLRFNGDIKAEFEVKVFSKIPDRIEKFFVDAGTFVNQGAPIARIFATTIEQATKQAEAGLMAARAQEANVRLDFERAQRLFKENATSKQQYDLFEMQYEAAKAGLEQAEAALHSANSTLSDATVTSPIAGIVGKRYYEAGDMANPALPLVSVVQMERVKVVFNATETDLGKLVLGQSAALSVKSYPDEKYQGKVYKISPILDPVTRMAEIEVLVNNPQRRLKPGMYASVEVTTGILTDVLVVPRHAVMENSALRMINGEDKLMTQYSVYVVNNDKAEQRKLDVQYVNHVQLAIQGGVNQGDLVVVAGQANLREGTLVKIAQTEGDAL